MLRLLPCLLLLTLCVRPTAAWAVEIIPEGVVEPVVHLASPEYRRIEKRLGEIEEELKNLPFTRETTWGSRYGHRSADMPTETTPDWIVLDMKMTCTIDMIALVPVWLSLRGEAGAGYGFPKRFKVEISDNPEMLGAVTLVDHSQADVPNPGRNPMVMEVQPTQGRFLRFTCLKHASEEGAYFWALEELMALEGNLNMARSADLELSSSLDLFPLWAPVRLVDGQHALGMPVDVTKPSPSIGYMGKIQRYSSALGGKFTEGTEPWAMVDLGELRTVEQVRVLPLESDEYFVYGGRGFPRQFEVQLALDPDFKEIVWAGNRGSYPLGYPAGFSITLQVPKVKARYARFLAKAMWSRDNKQVLGLAELQVYGEGQNLSMGRPVTVSEQADLSPDTGWAPQFLTDGYTSKYRLIEWHEYLLKLKRRGELERELAALLQSRSQKLLLGKRLVTLLAAAALILFVAAWIWVLAWQRRARREAIMQLRMQISRDLHDDIGSNLGGIVLLSEIGSEQSSDKDSRQDFQTIREAAEQASYSMRDIVWLVQREEVGLKDMVMRMRETADMILRNVDVDFSVEPSQFKDRKLSLLFRRHVFFAFKEAINNVRKHASAKKVGISIAIGAQRMKFTVRDDGTGFDPEHEIREGHGLGNLQRRARRVEGKVEINSKPGSGCEVTFEADYQ